MYSESKWAKEILAGQKDDGSWGYFHTLSEPKKYPLTTEQALRRLSILGYTIEDKPIQKAVSYMGDCLAGRKQIPDRREKLHDWDIFTALMLSTWIRRFTSDNVIANKTAEKWAGVISATFEGSEYNRDEYIKAYHDILGMKPKGGRLIDFVNFYPVSLTADMYDEKTEGKVFDYIMNFPRSKTAGYHPRKIRLISRRGAAWNQTESSLNNGDGIYYIYDDCLSALPLEFASKIASRYLGAIELLTAYTRNLHKLDFVRDWIMSNQNENGKWDMGGSVNDKIYFPLSDSWRPGERREADCTYRIQKLLDIL